MLARHSANVGMGREFGKASGARGGGSRNIWCDTELCLYLCPRLCPMFWEVRLAILRCLGGVEKGPDMGLGLGLGLGEPRTDLTTGDFAIDTDWKLNGPPS